mmetsp:Transcript_45971/g.131236  ORF Transcript_45971/g.131236 Transcript_45971/m.131236 type:complete len:106 (-) Transcript_45971:57-374(-)
MEPSDYMDVLRLEDGVFCWPHLIAAPATGKGALLVLGMPFLRAYYTTFDAAGRRVGLAPARQRPAEARLRAGTPRRGAAVALHGRRPPGFDETLAAALRSEHWKG